MPALLMPLVHPPAQVEVVHAICRPAVRHLRATLDKHRQECPAWQAECLRTSDRNRYFVTDPKLIAAVSQTRLHDLRSIRGAQARVAPIEEEDAGVHGNFGAVCAVGGGYDCSSLVKGEFRRTGYVAANEGRPRISRAQVQRMAGW